MALALSEFEIEGPETTIPFQRFILAHPGFTSWDLDVLFVQRNRLVESFNEKVAQERMLRVREGAAIAAAIIESGLGSGFAPTRTNQTRINLRQEARHYDAL